MKLISEPGQSGFGLLEVLIALLVLSIGSLGLLRLSVVSAASQREAVLQHRALAALEDLESRVRVNPAGLSAYAGAPAWQGCSSTLTDSSPCAPEVMAVHDMADWRSSHLATLPRAATELRLLDDGGKQALAVEIRWSSNRLPRRLIRVIAP